jgi:hypothetical protein
LALPMCVVMLALAACNGTAVVTVTSTPSSDTFLAYRVGLSSIAMQSTKGTSLNVLPSGTTVDFTKTLDTSELVGVLTAKKGTYNSAVVTFDYSAAQIIYDDGSADGVALTPVNAAGQPLGQVSVTVNLDPSLPFRIVRKQSAQLAFGFNLGASNLVNLTAKTVTVTPLIAASAQSIDNKQTRIRGPFGGTNTSNYSYVTGLLPFDGPTGGDGQLTVYSSDVTTYEINGTPATGTAGLAQLGGLGSGALLVSYGTLSSTTTSNTTDVLVPATTTAGTTAGTTTTTGTTTTDTTDTTDDTESDTTSTTTITFAVTQVLAGSSVQGAGMDRVSGVVSARSGNTLTIEDGTVIASDGTNSFVPGTTTVTISANTLVTVFGEGAQDNDTTQQISVGSTIDAFGTVTVDTSAGTATLDASAGRVRLDASSASGIVNVQGDGSLTLGLTALGGRAVSAFDFEGSGAASAQYVVNTGSLDLTNAIAGAPVVVSGLPTTFGTASPNFNAATLLDPTTIQAELVVDWGAGTAAPFTTFDTTAIDLDVQNSSIGPRQEIQLGSQIINVVGMSSDPLIMPSTAGSAVIFAIGHSVSGTTESFNTYTAFITQLQTELNGSVLATGITAVGQYTVSTFSFYATSITVFLNN